MQNLDSFTGYLPEEVADRPDEFLQPATEIVDGAPTEVHIVRRPFTVEIVNVTSDSRILPFGTDTGLKTIKVSKQQRCNTTHFNANTFVDSL